MCPYSGAYQGRASGKREAENSGNNPVKRRCRYESKSYPCVYGMQTAQLRHDEKQEKHTGQVGDEQVLQILQEAYSPQRNKVSGGNHYG